MTNVPAPRLLWTPSQALQDSSNIRAYMRWLETTRGLRFATYDELWRWSVADLEAFWESLWEYFQIRSVTPYTRVLSSHTMPGARWFEGATLNYVEHVFRRATPDHPAALFQSERQPLMPISWADLERQVASVAAALRGLGVGPGDRVVGYLPNIPQALVAFLAAASLGAVWSSCSPDFGSPSVIDRFKQIEPKVLVAVDGYQYGGKPFDRRAVVAEIQAALPTLEATIFVPYLDPRSPRRASPGASSPGMRPWRRRASCATNRCLSSIRSGCSTPRAPPACPSRLCRARAAFSSSTSRSCTCTSTSSRGIASSGTPPLAG